MAAYIVNAGTSISDINSAINSGSYDQIIFKAGTYGPVDEYDATEICINQDNITLSSEDGAAVTFLNVPIKLTYCTSNVTIGYITGDVNHGFTINKPDGDGNYPFDCKPGIKLNGDNDNVTIQGNTIYASDAEAIKVKWGADDLSIDRNTFAGNSNGDALLDVKCASDVSVTNNTFSGTGWALAAIDADGNSLVQNNIFSGSAYTALYLKEAGVNLGSVSFGTQNNFSAFTGLPMVASVGLGYFPGVAFDIVTADRLIDLSTTAPTAKNLMSECPDGGVNFYGNALDNVIVGSHYSDVLMGRAGNDVLDGGCGIDDMRGGKGNDTYIVDDSGDLVSEAANMGIDTVYSFATYQLSANVEKLFLVGCEAIDGYGNALANLMVGNERCNLLVGRGGNDRMFGGDGDDILVGGAGNNYLDGGNGSDTAVYAGTTGNIIVHLKGQTTTALTVNGVAKDKLLNVENIIGGSGNDKLFGDAQNNTLVGNGGADLLRGGLGLDTLVGGGGNDRFLFDTTPGVDNLDTLPDFTSGSDLILLKSTVFSGIPLGVLGASYFATVVDTTNDYGSAKVIFATGNKTLYWDADGFGGNDAVAIAQSLANDIVRTDIIIKA